MKTFDEIIDAILDTHTIAGLGVIPAVAKNIASRNGIERALTYLLGASDAAGASGNVALADLLRKTREALKEEFR